MSGERATKMLILSSARTLFSEKGYDRTPVEEICALAGIAKGTFFYHFENKQSIVRYILAMQMDEYREHLARQMDSLQDAISRVEYFIAALIEHAETAPETDSYFKEVPAKWYDTVLQEERARTLLPLLEEVVLEGIEKGYFHIKNPVVCSAVVFYGIDSLLKKAVADIPNLYRGIREMTAKALGLKEAALAISCY
jgi:AcrR family transcriptional regulator